ncbi:hypothetical protein [Streptomyces sp. NPDC057889]|uniref:hypothetical protein n=1 Tax=unclassified Streptomyces TaxID=2593676 RepID=UPI0036C6CD0F
MIHHGGAGRMDVLNTAPHLAELRSHTEHLIDWAAVIPCTTDRAAILGEVVKA